MYLAAQQWCVGGRTVAFAEVGVRAVGLVEAVLPLHHHAEVLVVEDHDLGLEALHGGRGELLAVHEERAVAVDVHHKLLRPAILPCAPPVSDVKKLHIA